MDPDFTFSFQDGLSQTPDIFKSQPAFVQIEDMKHTLSRQFQEVQDLHHRQQKLQIGALKQMEHHLQMEAKHRNNPQVEAHFAQITEVQLRESEALRENHQRAFYNMQSRFCDQDTLSDWSAQSWLPKPSLRPHPCTRQDIVKTGFKTGDQSGAISTSTFPDDRLGNAGATTLMVRNIPVRYTQEMLLKEWPNRGTYDFLYLPICIKKKCNTSFAFINFISSELAREFAQRWHHERLLFFSARKPLDISLADLQGLEKNLLQCMNNKTSRIRNIRFQPAVFKGSERVSVESVMKDLREKLHPEYQYEELGKLGAEAFPFDGAVWETGPTHCDGDDVQSTNRLTL